MFIFGAIIEVINLTKDFLNSKTKMKHLGEADLIQGITMKRFGDGFSLNQAHCVEKILIQWLWYRSFETIIWS